MRDNLSLFLLFIFTFFILSCAERSYLANYTRSGINLKRIAVIPFESTKTDVDLFANSEYFNDFLQSKLSENIVVDSQPAIESYKKIKSINPDNSYNETAVKVAQAVDADAFIYGFLRFYKEREGSDLGVRSPAVVNFVVYLVELDTNLTLWTYEFDESQLPLLSDVSQIKKFFKRKGKWITADQLFKEGLQQTAAELSKFLEVNN